MPCQHSVDMSCRVGGEVARATTVVNFKPNASFPMHQHVGGEDSSLP